MDAYWLSWVWLGHTRGARVAAELFELAKPYGKKALRLPNQDFEQEKRAIRGARDALQRVGKRAAPAARAAAGLVLAHAAPQYGRARERIEASVATLLPDCDSRPFSNSLHMGAVASYRSAVWPDSDAAEACRRR